MNLIKLIVKIYEEHGAEGLLPQGIPPELFKELCTIARNISLVQAGLEAKKTFTLLTKLLLNVTKPNAEPTDRDIEKVAGVFHLEKLKRNKDIELGREFTTENIFDDKQLWGFTSDALKKIAQYYIDLEKN